VRRLLATEIGFVVAFGIGVLVAYVGLAVFVSGENRLAGALVLVLGLYLVVKAPVEHDRLHRERGEPGHAVWGKGDRRKPPWWRGR
jgi:hypothetical protein